MTSSEQVHPWWKTLPGILSGLAAVLTAIAGLTLAFDKAGIFNNTELENRLETPAREEGSNHPIDNSDVTPVVARQVPDNNPPKEEKPRKDEQEPLKTQPKDVRITENHLSTTKLIVIPKCHFTYSSQTEEIIKDELTKLGIKVEITEELGPDWYSRKYSEITKYGHPDLIIIHYSCFQDKGRDIKGLEERQADMLTFLEDLSDTRAKFLIFSRALKNKSYLTYVLKQVDKYYPGEPGVRIFVQEIPFHEPFEKASTKLALKRLVKNILELP